MVSLRPGAHLVGNGIADLDAWFGATTLLRETPYVSGSWEVMPLACSRIGLTSSASMSSWVSRCSKAPVLLTARLDAAAARESGRPR